jgi:sialate O-acetylesterase
MEWPLNASDNAEAEIKTADIPTLRHFKVQRAVAGTPQDDVKNGDWKVCTPQTAGNFTAVGYYFAKQLMKDLHIPIGLINTTWGGTNSESWTSREAFESSDEFKNMIASLPKLNLDSINKIKTENLSRLINQFQGKMDSDPKVISQWKENNFDDSAWPKMKAPALWNDPLFGNLDGVVWFRKTITLDKAHANKPATLELGKIDDSDQTYVNGILVGGLENKFNEKRIYKIPASILKAGKNVIAVRIEDNGGGGGIYGKDENVKLTIDKTNIPLAGDWSVRIESPKINASVDPNSYPDLLYNAMINPLTPFAIKGFIWYQGETNAERAHQYRIAFPLMITDWRTKWNRGDLPFYFVQLATFNNSKNGTSETGSEWAELREAQAMTLSLPNTGMAVTTDIGNPNDIHPRNKKDVGFRLATLALKKTYGENIMYEGPSYQSMKADGNKVVITFNSTGSGLIVKGNAQHVNGFELAGEDQKFHKAEGKILNNEVVLSSAQVSHPMYVRYNWADDASAGNLFNKEGFPAAPFRTDTLKGITDNKKYEFAK